MQQFYNNIIDNIIALRIAIPGKRTQDHVFDEVKIFEGSKNASPKHDFMKHVNSHQSDIQSA
jgi:hypothetical protein